MVVGAILKLVLTVFNHSSLQGLVCAGENVGDSVGNVLALDVHVDDGLALLDLIYFGSEIVGYRVVGLNF